MSVGKVTKEAFAIMTEPQAKAVARLMEPNALDRLVVQAGFMELPDGYLGFVQFFDDDSQPIYGGIAPNGDVST